MKCGEKDEIIGNNPDRVEQRCPKRPWFNPVRVVPICTLYPQLHWGLFMFDPFGGHIALIINGKA